MGADRARRQEQPVRDVAVAVPLGGEADDLALLGGQLPQGIGGG
jgi:hypothetical protein